MEKLMTTVQVSQSTRSTGQAGQLTIQIAEMGDSDITITVQKQQQQQHRRQVMFQSHQQTSQQLQQQQHQQHQHQQSLQCILNGLNSLSMSNEPLEAAQPHHLSIDDQEPPAQLNLTKRRERAAARRGARPADIPTVPDTEDFNSGGDSFWRGDRRRNSPPRLSLKLKTSEQAVPTAAGGTAKLMRAPVEFATDYKDLLDTEMSNDILLGPGGGGGGGGGSDDGLRRRKPSAATSAATSSLAPDSPTYASCGSCSHASSSPPGSYRLAPTPPTETPLAKPKRGRPPKPKVEGFSAAAAARARSRMAPRPAPLLQPRLAPVGGVADFVPAAELAEAVKVIGRYSDSELFARYENGDLMSHRLAREANWSKLVALNQRWLSSDSLGSVFTSINSANQFGHTPLLEAAVRQNGWAVDYCCLFTSSSDGCLFHALVEAALLDSDAIFYAILRTASHEMDENGNAVKRPVSFIDRPIGGWKFSHPSLAKYAGLTLAQALTLQPKSAHGRLAALIGCGACPSREIGADADPTYRAYIDCVHLAAAFSPAPFECLQALGMSAGSERPLKHDASGEILDYCVRAICKRTDLPDNYKRFVCAQLPTARPVCDPFVCETGLPLLDPEDIERVFKSEC